MRPKKEHVNQQASFWCKLLGKCGMISPNIRLKEGLPIPNVKRIKFPQAFWSTSLEPNHLVFLFFLFLMLEKGGSAILAGHFHWESTGDAAQVSYPYIIHTESLFATPSSLCSEARASLGFLLGRLASRPLAASLSSLLGFSFHSMYPSVGSHWL